MVDALTVATCTPPLIPPTDLKKPYTPFDPFSCALEGEKHRCLEQGGSCAIERDGYYLTNVLCVLVGAATFILYIRPAAKRLSALPLKAWREYEPGK